MTIHTYDTLYKKAATGKTVIWYTERDGAKYRSISGQIDGKLITGAWTTAKPKNVGKANETTPIEQAVSEVDSKYEKKIASGYFENESEVNQIKFVKPMLAIKYEDSKIKFWDNLYVSPKYDGVRCIVSKSAMMSRAGKPILGAPHILEFLEGFFKENPDVILDGELYNHELKDNFNKIVSLVRKEDPSKEELKESRKLVQYHIYDLPSSDEDFISRYKTYRSFKYDSEYVRLVGADQVHNEDELMTFHEGFIKLGYEGTIIRNGSSKYQNKRCNDLIKLKNFQDSEFKILGVQEGKGNREGLAATIECKAKNGTLFYPTVIGGFEYCRDVWLVKDQFIGGQATINYFGYTPDGVPRFPRATVLYQNKRDI